MIPEATPAPATNCPTCGPSAADEDAAFCQRIIANEATFNTLLYFDNGEGAPIPPDQVNWSEVDALLAPTGFTQYDVSGVSSFPFLYSLWFRTLTREFKVPLPWYLHNDSRLLGGAVCIPESGSSRRV